MTNEWNLVSVIKPETHKDVLFSDGKSFFDGFLGCDKTVYRNTAEVPVAEPKALYWTNKPKVSENEK
jgi:hypothetical protein|tara:strand:- start:1072 stop:1272 length:201 start_codon:yes stop_codon:yes gene_type:complete